MDLILDTHTHTLASGHAYNTINEMAKSAADKGLKLLAITDHAPAMPGSCSYMYFLNRRALKREKYGIILQDEKKRCVPKWTKCPKGNVSKCPRRKICQNFL